MRSVKPTLVPIVWFDDEARLTPEIHSQLALVIGSLTVMGYVKYMIPAMTMLTAVFAACFIVVQVGSSFSPDGFCSHEP